MLDQYWNILTTCNCCSAWVENPRPFGREPRKCDGRVARAAEVKEDEETFNKEELLLGEACYGEDLAGKCRPNSIVSSWNCLAPAE